MKSLINYCYYCRSAHSGSYINITYTHIAMCRFFVITFLPLPMPRSTTFSSSYFNPFSVVFFPIHITLRLSFLSSISRVPTLCSAYFAFFFPNKMLLTWLFSENRNCICNAFNFKHKLEKKTIFELAFKDECLICEMGGGVGRMVNDKEEASLSAVITKCKQTGLSLWIWKASAEIYMKLATF